jgi:hypothetical protein
MAEATTFRSGRAGQPYVKSVQAKWCTAATALPDPDLVLKRKKVKNQFGEACLIYTFSNYYRISLSFVFILRYFTIYFTFIQCLGVEKSEICMHVLVAISFFKKKRECDK